MIAQDTDGNWIDTELYELWWQEMADSCDESAPYYSEYASPSGLYEGLDNITDISLIEGE